MNLAPLSFGLWGLYVFNWKLHCAPRLRIYRIFSYSHPTTVELCWIWSLWDIERITPKKAWLQILPSYFWSTPVRHTIAYIACVYRFLHPVVLKNCKDTLSKRNGEISRRNGAISRRNVFFFPGVVQHGFKFVWRYLTWNHCTELRQVKKRGPCVYNACQT